MQLSKRLKAVASLVEKNGCAADIGCDHGFVPIYLIKQGIVRNAIAMDIKTGPLERAKAHIEEYGLGEKIQTRLSNGMEQLKPGEADTVIMSGIGGPLLIHILKEGKAVAQTVSEFILSPQSEIESVRRFLELEHYQITKEVMVLEDEKYYTIMHVIHGTESCDREIDYRYGKTLLVKKDPVLYSYLKKEQLVTAELIKRLESSQTDRAASRSLELRKQKSMIEEALRQYR